MKKIYTENTANMPALGASSSGGTCWRNNLIQMLIPSFYFLLRKSLLSNVQTAKKWTDRHRRRSNDQDIDNSGRSLTSEIRGCNGRRPPRLEVDHSVREGQSPNFPKSWLLNDKKLERSNEYRRTLTMKIIYKTFFINSFKSCFKQIFKNANLNINLPTLNTRLQFSFWE